MAKAQLKTRPRRASPAAFLAKIADPETRRDCRTIAALMRKATGARPVLWGSAIVGFGDMHYKSESGREGDWFLTGFSPRAREMTLYMMTGFRQHAALMKRLGKHKTGGSCLYIRRLADVDLGVLKKLIAASVKATRAHVAVMARR